MVVFGFNLRNQSHPALHLGWPNCRLQIARNPIRSQILYQRLLCDPPALRQRLPAWTWQRAPADALTLPSALLLLKVQWPSESHPLPHFRHSLVHGDGSASFPSWILGQACFLACLLSHQPAYSRRQLDHS